MAQQPRALARNRPDRVLLAVGALLLGGAVLLSLELDSLQRALVQDSAREHAEQYARALEAFRTVYTNEVVSRARDAGVVVTHDYTRLPGAIPLPATLSILLGDQLAGQASSTIRLFSDAPFPWRVDTGGPRDDFEAAALRELRTRPRLTYARFEDVRGVPSVRLARADVMRPACVRCHNSHPETPRSDWKVGDVRGVLEVTLPITAAIQRVQAGFSRLRKTALATLLGIGVLFGVLALSLRRRSMLLSGREADLERAATEHSEMASHLARERTRKTAILETLGEAIVSIDAAGVIVDYNDSAVALLGIPAEAAFGVRLDVLLEPRVAQPAKRDAEDAAPETPRPSRYLQLGSAPRVLQLRSSDANIRSVEVVSREVKFDGQPFHVLSFRDVTEALSTRAQLEEALRAAEAGQRDLETFNRLAVDRELRMLELKREVDHLCQEGGKPARYALEAAGAAHEELNRAT